MGGTWPPRRLSSTSWPRPMSPLRIVRGLRDLRLFRRVGRQVRQVLSAPAYAARARRAVREASHEPSLVAPPSERFARASDAYWGWLNTHGVSHVPGLSRLLPALPSEELQLTFTGSAGEATLREGWQAFGLFRSIYEKHGGRITATTDVLDFGCGWGRIIRYFNRDVRPGHLYGADINPTVLDYCRSSNPWASFHKIDVLPPSPFENGSFDLIYAYSVFSHLSRVAHDAWLVEFERLLRPGGVLIVTTWPREFIEHCEWLRTSPEAAMRPDSHRVSAGAFTDLTGSLSRYDAGEFCFSYRNEQDPAHFGEACLSERFVRSAWPTSLEIRDYIDRRDQAPQNVIVARRRD